MKPDAPLLHERLASLSNINMRPGGTLSDDDPTPGSNLANRFEFRLGDVDKGFQEADVIVEHETFTSPIHQGYIEPHTGTAMWHNDGTLTIWSSSQGTSMCAIRRHASSICLCPRSERFPWRSAEDLAARRWSMSNR